MDGVVLSQVTVVPPHRGDAAAAVLLHRGVLWFARGWEPDDRGNSGRLIHFSFAFRTGEDQRAAQHPPDATV